MYEFNDFSKHDPYPLQGTGKISLSEYGGLIAARGLSFNNVDKTRNFSGMKTFNKPEWYNTVKIARARSDVMTHYFRKTVTYSRGEISKTLGPFWTEYFLPGSQDSLIEACKFKEMPRKISSVLNRSITATPNLPLETIEDVDNMIIDSDED